MIVMVGGSLFFVQGQNTPSKIDWIQSTVPVAKPITEDDTKVCICPDSQKTWDDADTKKGDCSCAPKNPLGKKSCLGVVDKDANPLQYKTLDGKVSYLDGESYSVGKWNNDNNYCMWHEGIQMWCKYIGAGDPTTRTKASEFKGSDFCCGTKLNTDVPFVGRCVTVDGAITDSNAANSSTATSVFPRLMKALSNIALTLIFVGSMIMLVASGVVIASGNPWEGKNMIKRVVLSLVLLGASGIILRLINPVFFG